MNSTQNYTPPDNSPDTDHVVNKLKQLDIPVTRENYIDLNWLGEPPDPWTPEDEEQLPEELQDWSVFGPEMEKAMYEDNSDNSDEDYSESDLPDRH